MDLVEKRTISKVMWRLMPFLFLCYFVAYLDRVNVGFAKLQMASALNMSETAYGFGAGLFFVVTLIAAGTYLVRKRQIERQVKERAKSTAQAMFADPMVVAAGLQVVRAIGIKRLVPILAVGGLALGLLAGRNSAAGDQAPAE